MHIEYLLSVILFFAALVQGFTGFGLALISVSLLSLLMSPTMSVPLAGIFGWLVTFPIVAKTWKEVARKDACFLILGSFPGAFLGSWILKVVDKNIILITMGLILVISGTYFFFRKAIESVHNNELASSALTSGVIGFLSGSLGASVGEPGPPIIAHLSYKGWHPKKVKATLSLFFMIQMIGALLGFYLNGFITLELGRYLLWAFPGFIAGTFLGIFVFDHALNSKFNYYKLVHALLVFIGFRLLIGHTIEFVKNL